MIQVLVWLRYAVIFASAFMGFYYIDTNPEYSMKIVSAGMVGIVGILSFITHVIFHKADAKRLGWETDRPDWQFEVGFANLAFGIVGLIAYANFFGNTGRIAITMAYGIYLFQAAILHAYRAISVKPIHIKKLVLSSLLTFVFVAFMAFFVYKSVY
ncbi:MAG: hypothetical protein P9L91_06510 [Candidatus Zophobacter franzmannii]|jgi:hypothetical protein|nr:hypothetical protein [Candidatus Zophobacter franzmannii]